jgi:hypothetical protein
MRRSDASNPGIDGGTVRRLGDRAARRDVRGVAVQLGGDVVDEAAGRHSRRHRSRARDVDAGTDAIVEAAFNSTSRRSSAWIHQDAVADGLGASLYSSASTPIDQLPDSAAARDPAEPPAARESHTTPLSYIEAASAVPDRRNRTCPVAGWT